MPWTEEEREEQDAEEWGAFRKEYVLGMKIPEGPWSAESDLATWMDPSSGIQVILLRSPEDGSLSGYVGVLDTHPWFGVGVQQIFGPDGLPPKVHGGVTYSSAQMPFTLFYDDDPMCDYGLERWWIGFHCAHSGDLTPSASEEDPFSENVYRDGEFVEKNLRLLVEIASRLTEEEE